MHIEALDPRRLFAFGDLDTTFSGDGIATDDPAVTITQIKPTLDGRLVGLATSDAGVRSLRVYRADGSLDTTFGGDGAIEFGATGRVLEVIAVDKGKFVVLSAFYVEQTGDYRLELARYKVGGQLDKTAYGTNGIATLPNRVDVLSHVRVARDPASGNLSIATADLFSPAAQSSAIGNSRVTRVSPTGQILGTPLALPQRTGTNGNTFAYTVTDSVYAPDGKLWLTGIRHTYATVPNDDGESTVNEITREVFNGRVTAAGAIDTTFDTDGFEFIDYTDTGVTEPFVVLNPAGQPVAVYQTLSLEGVDVRIFRTRNPVTNENRAGAYNRPERLEPLDVRTLPDGRIVIFGRRATVASDPQVYVATLDYNDPRIGGRLVSGPEVSLSQQGIEANDGGMTTGTIDAQGRIIGAGRGRFEGNGNNSLGRNDPRYHLSRLTAGTAGEDRPDRFDGAYHNSIVYDANGNLHFFYHGLGTNKILYAHRDSAGRWTAPVEVDTPPPSYNAVLSASVSPAGVPGVAYTDFANADLIYLARRPDGSWDRTVVDSKGSTGLYPSLRFADDGRAYIAYFDRSANALQLAAQTTQGGWTIDTIAPGGRLPDLAINPATNRFAIAFQDAGGVVSLAERLPKQTAWSITPISATAAGVSSLDLGYSKNGTDVETIVAYHDAGPGDAVVARRPAASAKFSGIRVARDGATGLTPQVAARDNDVDNVYFYDRTRQVVRRADLFDGGDGVPVLRAQPAFRLDNARPLNNIRLSVATTPTRFFQTFAYLDKEINTFVVRDLV